MKTKTINWFTNIHPFFAYSFSDNRKTSEGKIGEDKITVQDFIFGDILQMTVHDLCGIALIPCWVQNIPCKKCKPHKLNISKNKSK